MNSFRRNTLFAAVGNLSMVATLAVMIVVIARLGDPEKVGRYSYALAICAPVFLLAHLRLRDIKATDASTEYNLDDYLRLSIFTNTLAACLVAPVCFRAGLDIHTVMVAVMIGFWKTTLGLSDIVYGFHQRNRNLKTVSRLQVTHALATITIFVTLFAATGDLVLSLWLLFPANLIIFCLVDVPSTKGAWTGETNDNRRVARLKKLAWGAFPMGLAGAIFSLNMVIPRGLLEHHFSLAEVGVFSSLAFLARAGTPLMQAMGQASSRQLADSVSKGNAQGFAKILWKSTAIPLVFGIFAVGLGTLVGQQVIKMIYGAEYHVSRLAIALIALYATLIYISTVLTFGVIAARRLKSQLLVLSLTVLTVLVAGTMLIPEHGITGACAALAISSVVRIIGNVIINIQAVQSMAFAQLKAA